MSRMRKENKNEVDTLNCEECSSNEEYLFAYEAYKEPLLYLCKNCYLKKYGKIPESSKYE